MFLGGIVLSGAKPVMGSSKAIQCYHTNITLHMLLFWMEPKLSSPLDCIELILHLNGPFDFFVSPKS